MVACVELWLRAGVCVCSDVKLGVATRPRVSHFIFCVVLLPLFAASLSVAVACCFLFFH